jgi:CheY-like chemotaxis protein
LHGPAGVAKALELKPQLVLIDLGLPGFDGYEVARRIRLASVPNAIRLIVLTGYEQNEYRARAQPTGFDGYLIKPVDAGTPPELIAAPSAQRLGNTAAPSHGVI